ncbi:putative cation efflux protein [Helianthus anomalus]
MREFGRKVFPQQSGFGDERIWTDEGFVGRGSDSVSTFVFSLLGVVRSGNRLMKRLVMLISLNVGCSTAELVIGLLSGQAGLVSDAFHLTFGCGLLTFSLLRWLRLGESQIEFILMEMCLAKWIGFDIRCKRLEVLSAFTNSLFLLFMSFSLAVEALHTFVQDESEHKHYLIVSAVPNLSVNLIGIWFFRNYARVSFDMCCSSLKDIPFFSAYRNGKKHIKKFEKLIYLFFSAYRNAEDMNHHSVCLHVVADSNRSAGLILASWVIKPWVSWASKV